MDDKPTSIFSVVGCLIRSPGYFTNGLEHAKDEVKRKQAQANLGWHEEIGKEIPPSASAKEDDRKENVSSHAVSVQHSRA
jgi:hypothetical protein